MRFWQGFLITQNPAFFYSMGFMVYNNIQDFVQVYKNNIPKDICCDIIQQIQNDTMWEQHQYSNYGKNKNSKNGDKELDVLYPNDTNPQLQDLLFQYSIPKIKEYSEKFKFSIHLAHPFRINRYNVGSIMSKHYDHIFSLFGDAEDLKGIPILTILHTFNDDYEGGDFVMFEDTKIELGVGDTIIFPSNFMYPHRVEEVTKGIRYSAVSWVV